MKEKIWAYLDDHEYFLLIIAQVGMLIYYPFVIESTHSELLLHLMISIVLITGLYAVSTHKKFVVMTAVLGLCSLLLTWVDYILVDEHMISLLLHTVGLVFFCLITYNLITTLHTLKQVDQHMVFGAIAGYLLIGLIGAFVFTIIELAVPGSFTGFATETTSFPDFIYYSYVSMTTLGYGDVLPIGYHAQSWSIMFTIAGQMYLAVLIGMIVGKSIRGGEMRRD